MTPNMERGARIIIHEWVRVKAWDKVLIVTSKEHQAEAKALEMQARKKTRSVNTLIVENKGRHVGIFFDDNEAVFDPYTAIIAATEYSLVTTKAAKRAIQKHKKFLSLPLSTNDGRSLLEFDFLLMDTKKSRMMAKLFMKYLRSSGKVHVTTPAGTDMMFYKENRNPGFFNGVLRDGKGYSSSSIEVYVPIEETKTEGIMVLDGSLGYIGRADEPTRIIFNGGFWMTNPTAGYSYNICRYRGDTDRHPLKEVYEGIFRSTDLYRRRAWHRTEFVLELPRQLLH